MEKNDPLADQVEYNLYDVTRKNEARCLSLKQAFNRNGATIFLGIGLHLDKVAGQLFPVICGAPWIDKANAIRLLQEAITALNTKTLDDAQANEKGL